MHTQTWAFNIARYVFSLCISFSFMFFRFCSSPCICTSVPEAPPQDVSGEPVDEHRIQVSWKPPLKHKQNGALAGYKIFYMENEPGKTDNDATVRNIGAEKQFAMLEGLATWTEYKIWVVAYTAVGDGPPSPPIMVQTDEDGRWTAARPANSLLSYFIPLLTFLTLLILTTPHPTPWYVAVSESFLSPVLGPLVTQTYKWADQRTWKMSVHELS